jgi:probable rRNA maturation factor
MISVSVANIHRREPCPRLLVARGVRKVLRDGGLKAGKISVVCVSDSVSRRMNRRYLRHDYATDVISFPLGEGDVIEGELYVNLDRVRVQARRYGVSRAHELARLVIHGTLHLMGYDDRTANGRKRMRVREDDVLTQLFRAPERKGIA